ncbi:hypothetical protein BH20VER3_BH20VER3_00670 [soil metagenome]
MESLIDRARKYVAKMPTAVSGQNGHGATYHVACVLVQGFGLSPSQAMPLLEEYNVRCEPPWSVRELQHKLDGAETAFSHERGRGYLAKGAEFIPSATYRERHQLPPPVKPTFANEALARFAGGLSGAVDLLWLAARSAEDPCLIAPANFLHRLYLPHEKVLIFTDNKSQGDAVWPDEDIPAGGPHGVWFLAQPVDGQYHPNPRQGTMSRRSEEAIVAWRYFVLESDQANLKQWLGAIVQFPLRVAAIYTSGRRSVHALVRVDARTKNEWDREREAMKTALVILGGDPGAMTAVRLTRLPGCRRGRVLQKLLYLNPQPPLRPICDLAPRRDVLRPWLEWASLGIADSDETGGAGLTRALDYYAPVSEECRQALARLARETTT